MTREPSRLQRELKQTRPFPSPVQEAMVSLFRTADQVQRRMAPMFEPEDITAQQYNVLRILRGAGADGLPTLEIAERMIEQTPGITRLLDRLERKQLVTRERCPTDRRQVTCRITPSGLEMLARLDRALTVVEPDLLGALTPTGARQLIRLLDQVRTPREPG